MLYSQNYKTKWKTLMVTYLLTSLHIQFSSLDFNGSMNDFFRDTKNEKRKREREREKEWFV